MCITATLSGLLEQAVQPLPLTREGLDPKTKLKKDDARNLFPAAPHPEAALAGLALQLGDWEGAHQIAQDVASREGSYWHAIIHRMEPDYSNAGYWFRRVGSHPIFPDLATAAQKILDQNSIPGWHLSHGWDPQQFITWIEQAVKAGASRQDKIAREIQEVEIRNLFNLCAGHDLIQLEET